MKSTKKTDTVTRVQQKSAKGKENSLAGSGKKKDDKKTESRGVADAAEIHSNVEAKPTKKKGGALQKPRGQKA